jgi:hypothetical protein
MEETLPVDSRPKRNGLFIIMLVLLTVKNVESALFNLFTPENVASFWTSISSSIILLLGIGSLLNIGFLYAIYSWKKWGLFGYSLCSLIISIINLTIGFGVPEGLFWIISTVLLIVTLHIGKEQKAWSYLE